MKKLWIVALLAFALCGDIFPLDTQVASSKPTKNAARLKIATGFSMVMISVKPWEVGFSNLLQCGYCSNEYYKVASFFPLLSRKLKNLHDKNHTMSKLLIGPGSLSLGIGGAVAGYELMMEGFTDLARINSSKN